MSGQTVACPTCGAPATIALREVVMVSSDEVTKIPTGIPLFSYAAAPLARLVIETHERFARKLEWDPDGVPGLQGKPKGRWRDVGPMPRPICMGDDHDGANGGPWPCDAVKLARLILGEPEAGGSDEADET